MSPWSPGQSGIHLSQSPISPSMGTSATGLLCVFGGSNSGPHTFKANTFLTKPTHWPTPKWLLTLSIHQSHQGSACTLKLLGLNQWFLNGRSKVSGLTLLHGLQAPRPCGHHRATNLQLFLHTCATVPRLSPFSYFSYFFLPWHLSILSSIFLLTHST